MKKHWKPVVAIIAAAAFLALVALRQGNRAGANGGGWGDRMGRLVESLTPNLGRTYALCLTNVEHDFVVHDAVTAKPIADAALTVYVHDMFGGEPNDTTIHLVTDDEGRAKLLRKDSTYEEISAPFRRTVVIIFMNWGEFNVEASGYQPIQNVTPRDVNRVDKGYFRDEQVHRVEYRITLNKKE
jgi:hypothetical protein